MSGDARQAVECSEAKNRFDSDHKKTSLHHGNPDAEIQFENGDGPMSHLGQPTELRNGNEPRGCRIPPYAAGPIECNSSRDEEQQKQLIQLPNCREPRSRWITEREWIHYIQEDHHCPRVRNRRPFDVSIFRVPKFLKDTQSEAYVPRRVSLGPYHHRSAELPEMGHDKGRALRRMMKRFNANKNRPVHPNDMDFANRAMEEILKLENQTRDSYAENIDCDGKELARMLCLDGCFLIEVLRTSVGDNLSRAEARKYYDPIFGEKKLGYAANDVSKDILMLENQIPFIVLLKLLELEFNSAVSGKMHLDSLMEVILPRLNPFRNKKVDIKQLYHHHHLLDVLHAVIASPSSSSQGKRVDQGECSISIDCCSRQCNLMLRGKSKERNDSTLRIPHAVELRNAGIKFSALQEDCIKQIKFDKNSATIFLPRISIMDGTERVFRNLIAYEMCKPSEINYVSSYGRRLPTFSTV